MVVRSEQQRGGQLSMKTINEQEFKRLCDEVIADATITLQHAPATERQSLIKRALHARLCQHLGISVALREAQAPRVSDSFGNAILLLLEQHMQPRFDAPQAITYFYQKVS